MSLLPKKFRIPFLISITALVFAVNVMAQIPESVSRPLAPMMDCPPIDLAKVNDSIPVPEILELVPFTNDNINGSMFVNVCWHELNDTTIDWYYMQMSRTPEFETIEACQFIRSSDTCVRMFTTDQGEAWYRVRAVDTNQVDGRIYGLPSDTVSTILDITAPSLDAINMTITGHVDGTSKAIAEVEYFGQESYPDKLLVAERPDTNIVGILLYPISYSITSESGMVVCTLSYDYERKYIHVQMIDKAGNGSNVVVDSNIIAETSAHNYPNPFNPNEGTTTIVFNLLSKFDNDDIDIYIYDLFGNLVLKKICSDCSVGINSHITWDGTNGAGFTVADGGYICIIKAGNDIISLHKMAVVK